MKFDKLTNQQLFRWLKTHPNDLKDGLLEIEKRWLSFWNAAKSRIAKASEQIRNAEKQIEESENWVRDLEFRVRQLQIRQARLASKRSKRHLLLIQNNIQSVVRQMEEKDPKPYIPESQMEAFQEFLIKLKIK